MYPILDPTVQHWLWETAEQERPREAVGLVVGFLNKNPLCSMVFRWWCRYRNVAYDASVAFQLDDMDETSLRQFIHASRDTLPALWHSHVTASPTPSPADVQVMDDLGIPMLIVSLAHKKMVLYSRNAQGQVVPWGWWQKS